MEERRIMRGLQGDLQSAGFREDELLAPEQALAVYLGAARLLPLKTESVPLSHAASRVLARAVRADRDYPGIARSAMDGFAVRAAETPGTLRCSGAVLMGGVRGALGSGEAKRIPTGGVVPEGADAVVPIEDVRAGETTIAIEHAVERGACITPPASDMRAGEMLLEPGRRLRGPEMGVLATLGMTEIEVYRVPEIAVISSGDELVPVDTAPHPGQVRDSNRWAIAAALHGMGARARHYPIAPDDPQRLKTAIGRALEECDAVFLTGGSSVGERDFTPRMVAELGEPGILVHGLRVRPGKPTMMASIAGVPVLGLPGNPASALMILEAVGGPLVGELAGAPLQPARVVAALNAPLRKRPGWTWYVPVVLEERADECLAHPLSIRSSSSSLAARASGFTAVGESIESLEPGSLLTVQRFS